MTETKWLRAANERGKEEERRHVVAWLRGQAKDARTRGLEATSGWYKEACRSTAFHLTSAADLIEAGKHLDDPPVQPKIERPAHTACVTCGRQDDLDHHGPCVWCGGRMMVRGL